MSHDYKPPGPEEHAHARHQKAPGRQLHKDWRLWVAVGLMLLAMLMYAL